MATLSLVATPIGNLEDITLRALRVLREADMIFCEDTRVTKKLLAHYNIEKPLVSLRERAQDAAIAKAITLLADGTNIAYVTDAGTPGIADPGGKLVARVVEALGDTVRIVPVPGSSAIGAIASIAGISMDRFTFMGFPPHKKGRKTYFTDIAASECPVVFYESPHRIVKCFAELAAAYAAAKKSEPRLIVLREATKAFETIYRGPLSAVSAAVAKNVRGEFVLVVSPK